MTLLRTFVAVVAGYAAAALIVLLVGIAAGVTPADAQTTRTLSIGMAASFLSAILAGYLTARLSPAGRILLTVGLLGLVFLARAVVLVRLTPDARQPPTQLALATLLAIIGVWTGAMTERAIHARKQGPGRK